MLFVVTPVDMQAYHRPIFVLVLLRISQGQYLHATGWPTHQSRYSGTHALSRYRANKEFHVNDMFILTLHWHGVNLRNEKTPDHHRICSTLSPFHNMIMFSIPQRIQLCQRTIHDHRAWICCCKPFWQIIFCFCLQSHTR